MIMKKRKRMSKRKLLICLIVVGFLNVFGLFLYSRSFAYFSFGDDIRSKLINFINGTSHKIQAAVYIITDKSIAQALINAKKRGVKVELVTDKSCLTSLSGKIALLKSNNIEIFVFLPSFSNKFTCPLMHNKFAIFDMDGKEKQWIWTGSYNWTDTASKVNQENVIVTNDKKVCDQYKKQFELLKKACVLKTVQSSRDKPKIARKNRIVKNKSWADKIKDVFQAPKKRHVN